MACATVPATTRPARMSASISPPCRRLPPAAPARRSIGWNATIAPGPATHRLYSGRRSSNPLTPEGAPIAGAISCPIPGSRPVPAHNWSQWKQRPPLTGIWPPKRDRPMLLSLPKDSQPVHEMFERFFAMESSTARVRAAEPVGFDPALWRELVTLDAPFMRLSEEAGGSGMSLFDATVMMEQAGRR